MSNAIAFDIIPMPYSQMTYGGRFNPKAKKYTAYKRAIQWTVKKEKFIVGHRLSYAFFIPMPPSWSIKKQKRMVGTPCQSKPDIDNLVKAINDSFFYGKGGDQQVYEITARKVWSLRGCIVVKNITGDE